MRDRCGLIRRLAWLGVKFARRRFLRLALRRWRCVLMRAITGSGLPRRRHLTTAGFRERLWLGSFTGAAAATTTPATATPPATTSLTTLGAHLARV
jgi:hypothetical protein